MTDHIFDKQLTPQEERANLKVEPFKPEYPTNHIVDDEAGPIDCGEVDPQEGYCRTCGMFLTALNTPILTDDDIPF